MRPSHPVSCVPTNRLLTVLPQEQASTSDVIQRTEGNSARDRSSMALKATPWRTQRPPDCGTAKLDGFNREWFDAVIAPLLHGDGLEFVGEVNTAQRATLLGGAVALLHPSQWSEPFGLAAVEAMACGTPVVALRRGAADEVIDHGTSGIVVDDEDDLAEAVRRAIPLDRAACRVHVASRFTHVRTAARISDHALRRCGPARVDARDQLVQSASPPM